MTPLDIPADACDCHMHVYTPGYALAPTATFQPPVATVDDYQQVQRRLGFSRVIVVQPTAYGLDNRCTLDAVARLGPQARGVAVVGLDVTDAELQALHAGGIRGVRFMMLAGAALPWEALAPLAARVAPLGWNINLQFDGREFAARAESLAQLSARLVIDHIGKFLGPTSVDSAAFGALCRLLDAGRTWIKLSAPYESSQAGPPGYADVAPLAQALARRYPQRMLWGTNWPHPNRVPRPDEMPLLEWVARSMDAAGLHAMLVANPQALYGFADAD